MSFSNNQEKDNEDFNTFNLIDNPFDIIYHCIMLRYFRQHPIYKNVPNHIDLKLNNIAQKHFILTKAHWNQSLVLYNPYLKDEKREIVANNCEQIEKKIKKFEKRFNNIIRNNIDTNELDTNISVFLKNDTSPIKLIDLFKAIDIDMLLEMLDTQINSLTHDNKSNSYIFFDNTNNIPTVYFNYESFYYYLQNQIFSINHKEKNLFGEACTIKQLNTISNFIATSKMKIFLDRLINNKIIQKEMDVLVNKLNSELQIIQSNTLDKKFIIEVKSNSKEFFWIYLQNFYNRLLGLKLYDILKDKNVKTVPKNIAKQNNLLKHCKTNEEEKSKLDKLTIYYKTTKKCIEYGLLLPFSSKYKL